MKKIVSLFILLCVIFLLSYSVKASDKPTANVDELNMLVNSYYNEGVYTKETTIYLTETAVAELVEHGKFHNNVDILERVTYFTKDALWMSHGDRDTKYSYYGTLGSDMTSGIVDNVGDTVNSIAVKKPTSVQNQGLWRNLDEDGMEGYYWTVKDIVATTEHEWSYSNGKYTSTNAKVIELFKAITAPCYVGFEPETENYIILSSVSIEEVDGKLLLSLYADNSDSAKLTSGSNLFSQAVVYYCDHELETTYNYSEDYKKVTISKLCGKCGKVVNSETLSLDFAEVSQVGGTNADKWTLSAGRNSKYIYFKATASNIDSTVSSGVDVYVNFGEQMLLDRVENTFMLNLYTKNGKIDGTYAYYTGNNNKVTYNHEGLERIVVTSGTTTTIICIAPIDGFSISYQEREKIAINTIAVKNGKVDELIVDNISLYRGLPYEYLNWNDDNTFERIKIDESGFNKLAKLNNALVNDKNIFENLATLSVKNGSLETFAYGETMFTDRLTQGYTFDYSMPDFAFGKLYTYQNIASSNFTAETDGYVIIVGPDTKNSDFTKAGFVRVMSKYNKTAKLSDELSYFVKWFNAGESYSYTGKYFIAFGANDLTNIYNDYQNLGTVGGTNTEKWNVFGGSDGTNIYFKAVYDGILPESSEKTGLGLVLQLGSQNVAYRNEHTHFIELYYQNGYLGGAEYYYPNNVKGVYSLKNLQKSIVFENGKTTIYTVVPFASFTGVDIDGFAISMISEKGNKVDVWTYNSFEIPRESPFKYVKWNSNNNTFTNNTVTEEMFEVAAQVTSGYVSGKPVFENMALITPNRGTMAVLDKGDSLFTDRAFKFGDSMPEFVFGKNYVFDVIGSLIGNNSTGCSFTVASDGYVIIIVPETNSYANTRTKIVNDGWVCVLGNYNYADGLSDRLAYYIKWCSAGEIYSYGKWTIALTNK